MIKIENVDVYGFEAAIRGMRNPMNSWSKSDSQINSAAGEVFYDVGENDLQLMKKLINAGTDHSKFMRMITVTCDITAPLYWWKECDTYKVGTVRNSCSTMHKIHDKEFTFDDFSCAHLLNSSSEEIDNEYFAKVNECTIVSPYTALEIQINALNACRDRYLKTKDKIWWWQMIQLLPSSYNQRSTIQFNYAVLKNMYKARKNHKLDEWHEFCNWVETLPYSELIIGDKEYV